METFLQLIEQYVHAWKSLNEYIVQGQEKQALASARTALDLASRLDTEKVRLEESGCALPMTLCPYDGYYVETLQELKNPAGLMIQRQWVPWPFEYEYLKVKHER